jgi:hypothetical protein
VTSMINAESGDLETAGRSSRSLRALERHDVVTGTCSAVSRADAGRTGPQHDQIRGHPCG